ncbi:MAG: PAS domain S-box protein [Planctomycetes bacterium]|nr:PAS domain S-box protein [Planctomycetota bacterium]
MVEKPQSVSGAESTWAVNPETFYRGLIQGLHDDIVVIDRNFQVVDINGAFLRRMKYAREDVLGRSCHFICSGLEEPCEHEGVRCKLLNVFHSGKSMSFRRVHQTGGGTKTHVDILLSPIWETSGEVMLVVEAMRDVTDLVQALDEKMNFERFARAILDGVSDGIAVADPETMDIRAVNDSFCRMIGYSKEEFSGLKLRDIHPLENLSEVMAAFRMLVTKETNLNTGIPVMRKDGSVFYADIVGTPVIIDGRTQIVGVFRDVTANLRSKKMAEEREKFITQVMQSSLNGIFIYDAIAKSTTFTNERASRITGWSSEELISMNGLDIALLFHPECREEFVTLMEQMLASSEEINSEHEYRVRRKDGGYFWCMVWLTAFERNASGRPTKIIGTFVDVTDKKDLTEQFRQSQKLESFGRLAGGVAHDFNNILMVILGSCDLANLKLPESNEIRSLIDEIRTSAEKAASLTRQLLAFSRKQPSFPSIVNVNDVIRGVEKMLRRLIGEDIIFLTDLDNNLRPVLADAGQFEQVIMNLVVNARDAMPSGGKLSIRTANRVVLEAEEKKRPLIPAGKYVVMSIEDTGCGIDESIVGKIFEPFFTTKEVGKGTGLGLSTVYGIVKQSGGSIVVKSKVKAGTTFEVYLPQSKEETQTEERENETVKGGPGDAQHILVVEDEPPLRNILERALRNLNYNVTVASSGAMALDLVERNVIRPDLLISDVVMPGMNGIVLASKLRVSMPTLKVILMSGYLDSEKLESSPVPRDVPLLHKPFKLDELATKISRILDGER